MQFYDDSTIIVRGMVGVGSAAAAAAAERDWRRCTDEVDEVDSRNYLIWSLKVIDMNRTIILPLLILFHFLAHLHPYAPSLSAQRSTLNARQQQSTMNNVSIQRPRAHLLKAKQTGMTMALATVSLEHQP